MSALGLFLVAFTVESCKSYGCRRSTLLLFTTILDRRFLSRVMRGRLRSLRGRIADRRSCGRALMSYWFVSSRSPMPTIAPTCSLSRSIMLSFAIYCRTRISMLRRRSGGSRLWRGEWSISSIPIFGDRGGVFAFAIHGSTDPSFWISLVVSRTLLALDAPARLICS